MREAFKNTPKWLGFNIELKYPTEAQLAAMPFRFYSRNYFVDSILKVGCRVTVRAAPGTLRPNRLKRHRSILAGGSHLQACQASALLWSLIM